MALEKVRYRIICINKQTRNTKIAQLKDWVMITRYLFIIKRSFEKTFLKLKM